ncbi:unnamed protein product [Rotaria sp. Silwood2]|nr:unnamed protein product [Rotaria sp. Silwood2]
MKQTIPMETSRLNCRIKFLQYVENLNLFESELDDAEAIRRQRFATRIYLCMLSLLMISLIIYAAILPRTIIVKKYRLSEYQFIELDSHHSDTLKCPCTHVAQQYGEIVHANVIFHEVCQSQFISQQYINIIYGANVSFISPIDIRTTLSAFWQLVRSFCDLAKNTLIDAYTNFNATILLSTTVQSKFLIETKVETSLNFSLSSALNNLKRNLLITHETILGNGFMSGLATNYYMYLPVTWQYLSAPIIGVNSFADGCSCSNSNGCRRPAVIFETNGTSNWTNVMGMMFDCLPSDAVLASSLECFYDKSCLSLVQNHIPMNMRLQPLKTSSRFLPNFTIQTLLDKLMIEELTTTVLYSSYYTQCNPTYCTYSYTRRFDVLFIFTLTTSAFGGVSVVLRILAPLLVKLVLIIRAWKTRRNPITIDNDQRAASDRKLCIKQMEISTR